MAAKITFTDEELTGAVDLCAIEYSACGVIGYLLSMHPDWKRRFKDTKGHIEAGAWREATDMPRR